MRTEVHEHQERSRAATHGRPRIALVCPGIGRVQRGYERFFIDLMHALRDEMPITLFKGEGHAVVGEVVPRSLSRSGLWAKLIGPCLGPGKQAYHAECLTYALAIHRQLIRGGYDIVHCIDPPLLRMLGRCRRHAGATYQLLFSHGGAFAYDYWPDADHVLHMSPVAYEKDREDGYGDDKITLLPVGVFRNRVAVSRSRSELREAYGISPDTFVILSIAAIDREHKRIDYLVDEVAQLEGDCLLWLDGRIESRDGHRLVTMARNRLEDRCRITHIPSDSVGELLAMADVKVLTSLHEAFGIALLEAMMAGVPVMCHDAPHFRWLTGERQIHVDMSSAGALSSALREAMRDPGKLQRVIDPDAAFGRFGWPRLKDEYIALYERIALGRRNQKGA